jgi:chaperone required for assembly of F1-ATPase
MKRFYKNVSVGEAEGGWQVLLDGRGIKSAGGLPQVVAAPGLAEALAAEWAAQAEEIDPALFVLRDFADYAIDVVAADRERALAAILRFGESDTLCYRGDEGEALHERQLEVWEPLLLAAEQRWDIHFERISGIIHRPQPKATLGRMKAVLAAHDDLTLAALHTLTSLAASLVIALAAIEPGADPDALWQAANLEEDWQAELWGKDAQAQALRSRRMAVFAAAMRFAELARGGAAA